MSGATLAVVGIVWALWTLLLVVVVVVVVVAHNGREFIDKQFNGGCEMARWRR